MRRHGRRTRHHAGHLCFRTHRSYRTGPRHRTFPRHRYPSQILRPPARLGHADSGVGLPNRRRDRRNTPKMNPAWIGIIFLVLFAVVLIAISLGYRFLESQRKKQVAGMLQVVSGLPGAAAAPSILLDQNEDDPVEALMRKSQVTSQLSSMIQQSGLPWTVSRLVAQMAIGFVR